MGKLLVATVVAALLALEFTGAPQQGVSNTCVHDVCAMRASTSMLSIIGGLALLAFVWAYPQRSGGPDNAKPVTILQRLGAFYVDFLVVVASVGPLVTLPALLVEAHHTGSFQWGFERTFLRDTDLIATLPSVAFMFLALFSYFYGHAVMRRQTVGQYLLGYRVEGTNDTGAPSFAVNVILSFIGLCMWPVSTFMAQRRTDKAFWWNLATHTRAVRVRST